MKRTEYLKNSYGEPTKGNVENLENYLFSIGGKRLKLACIRQHLFNTSWTTKPNHLKIRARCHVQGAAIYIQKLIAKGIDEPANKSSLRVAVADILDYVKQLDNYEDTSFILVSPNTLPSTIHFFQANALFYNKMLSAGSNDSYGVDLLVLYVLRLSLEKRVNGILNTDFVKNAQGKPLGISDLIKISRSLTNINFYQRINWDQIEWVNKWLNHHIHRTLRPYPWIIYQALEVLGELLLPKQFQDGTKKVTSFYGSTTSLNLEELQNEVKLKIEREFPDAVIKWAHRHEICKVDNSDIQYLK